MRLDIRWVLRRLVLTTRIGFDFKKILKLITVYLNVLEEQRPEVALAVTQSTT
jgi:hypothetical protein